MAPLEIRIQGQAPFKTADQRQAAIRLVRRLANCPGVITAGAAPNVASLELLTGGRSAALVFKLSPLFEPGRKTKGLPVVVKIAPRGESLREKANYEAFVRQGLPANCRPELLGFALTGRYGGLCYSNVGRHDVSTIETLTDCLRRGEPRKLGLALRTLVDPMRETWFSPPLLRVDGDIAQHYLDRYFKGDRRTTKAEAALVACAADYFNARQQDGRTVIAGRSFPSPRTVLFGRATRRPYRSCILHGDLNTDNIVLSGVARFALVDFQKTGRGHVYRDLVSLEMSNRINNPRHASFPDVLETERRIALGRRSQAGDPYWSSICKIRDAAVGYFGQLEDGANYHFAVAAIGLRLMRAVDLSHLARARITASTLWATKAVAGEPLA